MTFDSNNLPDENRDEILAQAEIANVEWKFLIPLYDGDLRSAWDLMHPVLRLSQTQAWAAVNHESLQAEGHDPEEVAGILAQDSPYEHELWEHFERVLLREWHHAFPLDTSVAGIGAAPRPTTLDTELLYVHPKSPEDGLWHPNEKRAVYPLMMQLVKSQWKVLNWGSDTIPTPGLPSNTSQ